jgi:hypothetical protein
MYLINNIKLNTLYFIYIFMYGKVEYMFMKLMSLQKWELDSALFEHTARKTSLSWSKYLYWGTHNKSFSQYFFHQILDLTLLKHNNSTLPLAKHTIFQQEKKRNPVC